MRTAIVTLVAGFFVAAAYAEDNQKKLGCKGLNETECTAQSVCLWDATDSDCEENKSLCKGLNETECTAKGECHWDTTDSECEVRPPE